MIGKPKPALGLLVGVPDDEKVMGEEEDDGSGNAETMAFRGLRKALESGDDAAGASALKTFLEACGQYKSESPLEEV